MSPNRLAAESSPYLRQHAGNPVDWYPWGEDAFALARAEDKPILLSVGYSACHWCHVMAHESFEDPATAAVMNQLFVNVKVDREERPDVDAIYMEAVQALAGQGGWPMTVFLTPAGEPFYGGTYFPPRAAHGRPAFVELLRAIDEAWRERRGDLLGQAKRLAEAIRVRASEAAETTTEPTPELLDAAYRVLRSAHDDEWGGFGGPPKFPQPTFAELLLRSWWSTRSGVTMAMVTTTLDAMASGGIYDHLGGGFARYSVDRTWLVPHFEKMLYDQAGLVRVFTHAWQATQEPRWLQVVDETIAYVLRDLRSEGGGLSSAEDADSEGEEGRFYVWTISEIRAVVGEGEDAATHWYGSTEEGNFEDRNILWRPVRGDLVRPPEIDQARRRLFEAREARVRPGLDDKVLTEWNAMFVAALAEAGASAARPDWLDAACEVGDFLLSSLRRDDGRWMRSWQSATGARHLAYAADYAWLVDAFTRLAEATGQARWISEARLVAAGLLDLFWDDKGVGFFTTGKDAELLIARQKDTYDGATPSANAVAAAALLRLGALTGDRLLAERGAQTLESTGATLAEQPAAHTAALAAVDLIVHGIDEVAIVGDRADLVTAVQRQFLPNVVLAWGEPYDSPLWEGRSPGLAYVCRDAACKAPVSTAQELLAQLSP